MYKLFNEDYIPVTPENIIRFESKYQIKLPVEYSTFLTKYNGGEVEPSTFRVPKLGVEESNVQLFYGIGKDLPDYLDIEDKLKIFSDLLKQGFLIIGRDGFGCQILIGIEDQIFGKIFYYDLVARGRGETDNIIIELSPSFDKFLDDLYDFEIDPITKLPIRAN